MLFKIYFKFFINFIQDLSKIPLKFSSNFSQNFVKNLVKVWIKFSSRIAQISVIFYPKIPVNFLFFVEFHFLLKFHIKPFSYQLIVFKIFLKI